MDIFLQVISCVLSCIGYYLIYRKPKYSYIAFIILNILLFFTTKQYVMLFNIVFGLYYFFKTKN